MGPDQATDQTTLERHEGTHAHTQSHPIHTPLARHSASPSPSFFIREKLCIRTLRYRLPFHFGLARGTFWAPTGGVCKKKHGWTDRGQDWQNGDAQADGTLPYLTMLQHLTSSSSSLPFRHFFFTSFSHFCPLLPSSSIPLMQHAVPWVPA